MKGLATQADYQKLEIEKDQQLAEKDAEITKLKVDVKHEQAISEDLREARYLLALDLSNASAKVSAADEKTKEKIEFTRSIFSGRMDYYQDKATEHALELPKNHLERDRWMLKMDDLKAQKQAFLELDYISDAGKKAGQTMFEHQEKKLAKSQEESRGRGR